MKRKLDEKYEPVEVAPASVGAAPTNEPSDGVKTDWADLGLDPRLLQSIQQQKFAKPTLVQIKAIPLALEGRDIIARAKTGSGKTAAYVLPILQSILKRKQASDNSQTSALILVPTRELADQVYKAIETFTGFCSKDVQAVKLSDKISDAVQRSLLSNSPDIVVATPARAWNNISHGALAVDHLTHLVIDEADLVLSYGYDEDLQRCAETIPKGVQTVLVSATMTTEVETLQGIFCRNPVVLNLEEPEAEGEGVSQYVVKCAEVEKWLLTYVIFKLKLVTGKCIIFVADVDRCYRLKLFLEQFGIRSTILNSELPVNSRIQIVEQFNKNIYDIIIASDENEVVGDEDAAHDDGVTGKQVGDNAGEETSSKGIRQSTASAQTKKKRKSAKRDKEFGVSRGIDFKNVACVINFDLPTSAKSYEHRIGRTARAGQRGMSLSFVIPEEEYRKHMPTSVESSEQDERVLTKITKSQAKRGKEVKPYNFDMSQVDAFRYRMNDALRAVTKVAIREARTRELRQELLKSEKLKRHFEENPAELHHLRHDGELRAARTQAHLKHVPDYLIPGGKKALTANEVGFVPFKKVQDGKGRRGRLGKGRTKKFSSRRTDPLKSFKTRTRSK